MPELPDITVYIEALQARVVGESLVEVDLTSPFLLRTATPPLDSLFGAKVVAIRRLGKRIAFGFANEHWLVLHLMIAGRLHWYELRSKVPRNKRTAAVLKFASGSLTLTEAGTKKRAALHVVVNEQNLQHHLPAGLEPLECSVTEFTAVLRSENHTLKRSLTDQRLVAGIGNAYSDEILHAAKLSPMAMSQKLTDDQIEQLHVAMQRVLNQWTRSLRDDCGDDFPERVTAFRKNMVVHGRFGEPCPVCDAPIQRIRYASNETNYCAGCQTDGRIFADRSLSRLLKDDFPRRLEDLE